MRRGLVITAAAAALVMCATSAASASTGWAIQPTPNVSGATSTELNGVSCTSATNCIAVGQANNGSLGSTTVAEYWNGSTWTIQPTPNPTGWQSAVLDGVSCTSATNCTAVGSFYPASGPLETLAEQWNGSTWTIQTTPTRTAWTELLGVSCLSATNCVAAGSSFDGDGGITTGALIEKWNGSTWRTQTVPSPAGGTHTGLQSVSCGSPTNCTAVGAYNVTTDEQMLAEHWDGSNWTVQTVANPAGATSGVLYAVSCHTATSCVATGAYPGASAESNLALSEYWNGSTWTAQAISSPSGAPYTYLAGISCTLATNCTAVGYNQGSGGTDHLIAEHWTGSTWVLQRLPDPPTSRSFKYLQGVSCPKVTSCTAVGYASTSLDGATNFTVAEAN